MENKVMRIIAEISEVNESEIRMESELVDDLEVDSMMSLEILTELERIRYPDIRKRFGGFCYRWRYF